ncbi:hypothetical protein R1flu_012423 [Riccia fluitans]|uniref:Uncharacterized protein n=1 Tax=Riccia fluitans TaxID=41844 RepID=A0ABD1ZAW5_9MARC
MTAPGYGGVPKLGEIAKDAMYCLQLRDLLVNPVAGCAIVVEVGVVPAATVEVAASSNRAGAELSGDKGDTTDILLIQNHNQASRKRLSVVEVYFFGFLSAARFAALSWIENRQRHVQNIIKLYFTIGELEDDLPFAFYRIPRISAGACWFDWQRPHQATSSELFDNEDSDPGRAAPMSASTHNLVHVVSLAAYDAGSKVSGEESSSGQWNN